MKNEKGPQKGQICEVIPSFFSCFQGQPQDTMPYLRVLYPGLHELGLEFKDSGKMQVFTSVRNRRGERLTLAPLRCDGAGAAN